VARYFGGEPFCPNLNDSLFARLARRTRDHRQRHSQAPVAERPVALPPVGQWIAIMVDGGKFSSPSASFDPETLSLLADAFEQACERSNHRAINWLDQAMPTSCAK
jgi:hypothetical protein